MRYTGLVLRDISKTGRSPIRMAVIIIITVTACVASYLVISDHILSNAVARSTKLGFAPSENPQSLTIDPQTEGHTCGLHSLCSIYRAYGLNPDEHSLRTRLGVDTQANPVDATSTGTLQPDLTRVLAQDGFAIRALDLDQSDADDTLMAHLSSSNKSVALIRLLKSGNLHWVTLQQSPSGQLEVIDPLAKSPRHEDAAAFIAQQAVTVFLLGVEKDVGQATIKAAHRLGVSEMNKTPSRVKSLNRLRVF